MPIYKEEIFHFLLNRERFRPMRATFYALMGSQVC